MIPFLKVVIPKTGKLKKNHFLGAKKKEQSQQHKVDIVLHFVSFLVSPPMTSVEDDNVSIMVLSKRSMDCIEP